MRSKFKSWQVYVTGAGLALLLGFSARWLFLSVQSHFGVVRPMDLLHLPGSALYAQTMLDLNGQAHNFSAYRGGWVVINFWATWCPPCVAEMPELDGIYREFKSKNIRMMGIAIDAPDAVRDFQAKLKVSYPLVLGGLSGTQLANAFGNTSGALPYTVLIDPAGNLVWKRMGQIKAAELRAILQKPPV